MPAAALVFWCVAAAGVAAADGGLSGERDPRPELRRLGLHVLAVMRAGDVEGLLAMLDRGVVIGPEEMPRREAQRVLRSRTGLAYGYLFDTKAYREALDRWQRRHWTAEQIRRAPLNVRSVREQLTAARDVTVEVALIRREDSRGPAVAEVMYTWEGRPSLGDLKNCGFVLRPEGWRLFSVFSF